MDKINKLLEMDEFIYFLGYLWADGSISKKGKNTTLCIQEDDGNVIINNITKIGSFLNKPFTIGYTKPKKAHWKIMMRFYSGDRDLYDFLVDHEYCEKSNTSPEKILKTIPSDKHHIFYLGFFDGDGCVYNGEKAYKLYTVSFSGPYDYNWGFLEELLRSLDIKNRVYRYKRKKGANSVVSSTGMFNIEKLYNYLYNNIGSVIPLKRKRDKFEKIIEHVTKQTSREKGVCYFNKKYLSYITINGNQIILGTFEREEDAIKMRKAGVKMYNILLDQLKVVPDCSLLSL